VTVIYIISVKGKLFLR